MHTTQTAAERVRNIIRSQQVRDPFSHFAPWDTKHWLEKCSTIKFLKKTSNDVWQQQKHVLLDSKCAGLERCVKEYNKQPGIEGSKAELSNTGNIMKFPEFMWDNNAQEPPSCDPQDHFNPQLNHQPLSKSEIQEIHTLLLKEIERSEQCPLGPLRVRVNGKDYIKLDPRKSKQDFRIPSLTSYIEIVGNDDQGDVVLSTCILPDLEEIKREAKLRITTLNAQTVEFIIKPIQEDAGEELEGLIQATYVNASWTLSSVSRKFWEGMTTLLDQKEKWYQFQCIAQRAWSACPHSALMVMMVVCPVLLSVWGGIWAIRGVAAQDNTRPMFCQDPQAYHSQSLESTSEELQHLESRTANRFGCREYDETLKLVTQALRLAENRVLYRYRIATYDEKGKDAQAREDLHKAAAFGDKEAKRRLWALGERTESNCDGTSVSVEIDHGLNEVEEREEIYCNGTSLKSEDPAILDQDQNIVDRDDHINLGPWALPMG
jgi:hypothetical protein